MLLGLCSFELHFQGSSTYICSCRLGGNVHRENKHLFDTFYARMYSDGAVSVGGGGQKKIVILGLSNLCKFYRECAVTMQRPPHFTVIVTGVVGEVC